MAPRRLLVLDPRTRPHGVRADGLTGDRPIGPAGPAPACVAIGIVHPTETVGAPALGAAYGPAITAPTFDPAIAAHDAEGRPEDTRLRAGPDASRDVVLLLGPLSHLTDRDDRLPARCEARRVVAPGGLVVAAAISRFASLFNGLNRWLVGDPAFPHLWAAEAIEHEPALTGLSPHLLLVARRPH